MAKAMAMAMAVALATPMAAGHVDGSGHGHGHCHGRGMGMAVAIAMPMAPGRSHGPLPWAMAYRSELHLAMSVVWCRSHRIATLSRSLTLVLRAISVVVRAVAVCLKAQALNDRNRCVVRALHHNHVSHFIPTPEEPLNNNRGVICWEI